MRAAPVVAVERYIHAPHRRAAVDCCRRSVEESVAAGSDESATMSSVESQSGPVSGTLVGPSASETRSAAAAAGDI